MTDKIMKLADAYASAVSASDAQSEAPLPNDDRAALAAAIKAERDYTAAVIDERDAFCVEADVLRMSLTALQSERDKLTMVHAERTVERDRLRKVARPVLTALENYTTEPGGFCVCCGGEAVCRKDCEINNAIEALRTELDHV